MNFFKSELRNNDVVTYENGFKRVFRDGHLYASFDFDQKPVCDIDGYNEDLTYKNRSMKFDIVEIRRNIRIHRKLK